VNRNSRAVDPNRPILGVDQEGDPKNLRPLNPGDFIEMDDKINNRPESETMLRASWSRPTVRSLAASAAEQHSAISPDGLGDQLS
jgi:hypothetical protein